MSYKIIDWAILIAVVLFAFWREPEWATLIVALRIWFGGPWRG